MGNKALPGNMGTQACLQLCLVVCLAKAEFLGEDVKIKFVFDPYEENQDLNNVSSLSDFPFTSNLRNVSISSYFESVNDEEKYESTTKADRKDLNPGRALDIEELANNNLVRVNF